MTVTREGASIFIPADFTSFSGGLEQTGASSTGGAQTEDGSETGGAQSDGSAPTKAGAQPSGSEAGSGGFGAAGGTPQSGGGDETAEERQIRLRNELRARIQEVLTQRRIGALDDLGPLLGRLGSAPRFVGIASAEEVRLAITNEGGIGDGGETQPVTRARVREGVQRVEARISGGDGATIRPPVSTGGEQQETTFNAPPADLGDPPLSEIADANIATDIVNEINQIQDGLQFQGTWSALSGLNDGTFITRTDGLKFDLQFSLQSERGVVVIELPDAGDLGAPNLTTLGGEAIRGDRFLVTSDGDLVLTGDSGRVSLLGGNATNTDIVINAADQASGLIAIDYADSDLPNTAFVDGVVGSTQGVRIVSDPIDARIDQIRAEP